MKFLSKITLVLFVVVVLAHSWVCAANLQYVESFIDGEQDYIVFGTIEAINGNGACTINITEVVGSEELPNSDDEESADDDEGRNNADSEYGISLTYGSTIEVTNFNFYLYYDEDYRIPRKGDNVLLSLRFAGNVYMVENGAYLVTAADRDSFMIKAPETITDDAGAQITAIYNFVKSNGRNSDLTIRDGNVYTHESGKEKMLEVPAGINITNEHGDSIDSPNSGKSKSDGDNGGFRLPGEKWIYALIILVVGALIGILITHLSVNFEKKVDKK